MAGSREGGLKASQIMKEKYGKDYYRELGRRGGKITGALKGFSVYPDKAKEYGKTAGKKSKRGYKWLRDSDGYRYYVSRQDGDTYRFRIDASGSSCGERELVNNEGVNHNGQNYE